MIVAVLSRQAVRKVVTGIDASGASIIESDAPCECQAIEEQYVSVDLWATGVPAPVTGDLDVPKIPDIDAKPDEVIWRHFTLGPGERIELHVTETVDLMTVLSGEITLSMEHGSVVLSRGDCVVQRGTLHGWENTGAEPCTLIGVMIGVRR